MIFVTLSICYFSIERGTTMIKIIIGAVIALNLIVVYSCCEAASWTDDIGDNE